MLALEVQRQFSLPENTMKAIVIFVALLPLFQALSLPRDDPLPTDPAKLARWIVHNSSNAKSLRKNLLENCEI